MAGLGEGNKLLWNQPIFYKLCKLLTKTKTIPHRAGRDLRESWKCQVFTFGKLMGRKAASFTAYPVSPLQLCHPEGKLPPLENLAEELLEQGVCWCWRWWVERRCSNYCSTTCLPVLRRSVGEVLQSWWCSRTGRKWEVCAYWKLVLQMCFYGETKQLEVLLVIVETFLFKLKKKSSHFNEIIIIIIKKTHKPILFL